MATKSELEEQLRIKLELRAEKAFIAMFPNAQHNDMLVKQYAKKFAKEFGKYAKEEIQIIQQIVVATIGIDIDLANDSGSAPGYMNDKRGNQNATVYQGSLSKQKNPGTDNSRIVGRLDLKIRE